jgi:hypothetical protein
MQTVMSALEAAFTYFGGVPAEILFDQMKAVVVGDERPHGGRLLENAEFLRFAAHWDFRIRACRPYRAKTKGKVERPVFYVRDNFVYGREFLGDGDLNAQALSWLDEVANQRVHGTTREIPRERFEHAERAVLKPLAARPYQSLVVAPERLTARQLSHSQETTRFDTLSLDTRALVSVERRPLAAYAAYADAASPLCAEEGCP